MQHPVQSIELAPALAAYGDHAPIIARLARVRPSLMRRFFYAPASAVHAIAAFLHICQPAQPDEELAYLIDQTDPRDLLRLALPGAPAQLYRALRRAGDRAHDRAFYQKLGTLASGTLGDRLLRAGALDVRRLNLFEKVLNCDPLVVELFKQYALPEATSPVEGVATLMTFLRAHSAPIEGRLSVPAKSRMSAIRDRLEETILNIAPPTVPFDIAAPFRIVRGGRELRQIGERLENCLGDLSEPHALFSLIDGSKTFVACDELEMVASLVRVGPDLWCVEQVRGCKNKLTCEGDRQRLHDALCDAGVVLVDQTPANALSMLHYWRGKDEPDNPDDLEGLMEEALEDCED